MANDLTLIESPKNVAAYLDRPGVQEGLAKSATSGISPQRVAKIVCRILADPEKRALLGCTMSSLYTAISECVSLGLEPRLGRAYFVPYGRECKLILGYQGMLDLARRSGVMATAHAVFDGDEFLFAEGTNERIEHVPFLDGERNESTFRYAYVVSRLADGQIFHTVMNRGEIDKVRSRSKASRNGPWMTDYVEMAKKTVVRRAAKNWPLSVDAMEAFESDDSRTYAGQRFELSAGVGGSATEKLKQRLMVTKQTAPAEIIDVDDPTAQDTAENHEPKDTPPETLAGENGLNADGTDCPF